MKNAKITDSEIQRKFVEYVERMQDVGERHSKAAVKELDSLEAYLEGAYSPKEADTLLSRSTDVAVEFEESGFIAGDRLAMQEVQSTFRAVLTA